MFDLPDKYRMEVKLAIKDYIPKDLRPEVKKRIKNMVKEVKLTYQITGEEIPSVMNEESRCQVIQIYDITVQNIKDAAFIANTYQGLIKSLCILRIHDSVKEVYSFAIKRLSQTEENGVVLLDNEYTDDFPVVLPDSRKKRFLQYMSYNNIINKNNKVEYYLEMYIKEYIIKHEKVYARMEMLLNKPIWYDAKKVLSIYSLLKNIVEKKELVNKLNSNAEKVKVNGEIKEDIKQLETEI